jgi:hypothetical protein
VRVIEGRTHRLDLDVGQLAGAGAWIETQPERWRGLSDAVERQIERQERPG